MVICANYDAGRIFPLLCPVRELQVIEVKRGFRIGLADESEPIEILPFSTTICKPIKSPGGLAGNGDSKAPDSVAFFSDLCRNVKVDPRSEWKGRHLFSSSK